MIINTFFTPEQASGAVLESIAGAVKQLPDSGLYHLAISGGESPLVLFEVWVRHFAQRIAPEKLHLWWVDERCVPATDKESNYGTAKTALLDKIAFPAANVHFIDGGTADPEAEANRYGEKMKEYLLMNQGTPLFDTVLLGLGPDGHTASIFPGHEALLTDSRPCVATRSSTGQKRITLTGRPILNSGRVLFFVTGSKKADILHRLLNTSEKFPASFFVKERENVEFYLDEAAAGSIVMP